MNWPNFFIIGAAKAGTTSLYNYLDKYDQIFMSPVKEPNFFSREIITNNYTDFDMLQPIRIEKEYLKLFKNVKGEKAVGEASAFYLLDKKAPYLIKEKIPNAKIIMMLRNPVTRAFSHYLMTRQTIEKRSFSDVIREKGKDDVQYISKIIINSGFYFNQVKRYIDCFDITNIKIIKFEDFIVNPLIYVKEILEFLNIDDKPKSIKQTFNPYSVPKNNIAKNILSNKIVRKVASKLLTGEQMLDLKEKFLIKQNPKPKIEDEDTKFLEDLYKDDVKKLEILLGRKFEWF